MAADATKGKSTEKATSPPPKPRVERTVWYYNPAQAERFAFGSDLRVQVGKNGNATLNDLAAGKTARIGFSVENGVFIAHNIAVNPSAKPNNALRYVTGRILLIDPSAGTITIRHRP